MKIYRLQPNLPGIVAEPRYVRANTKNGAIRYLAHGLITCRVAEQEELVRAVTARGANAIENAKEEETHATE